MPENGRPGSYEPQEAGRVAPGPAGTPPPAGDAPAAEKPAGRANLLDRQAQREAERRGSERGVLILVAFGLLVLIGFAVAKTIPWSRETKPEPFPPPPLPELFRGRAKSLGEGRVELHYDLNRLWNDYNSPHMDWESQKPWRWEFVYLWKEPAEALAAEVGRRLALSTAPPTAGVSCARLAEGPLELAAYPRLSRGMVRGSRGFVVGPMRHRCIFDGDVALEFTAKLLGGAGINPQICGATLVGDDPDERRFYELALEAGKPGRARIRYYDYDAAGGLRRRDLAGPVEVAFEREVMYRVRFELAGERLVGYLAPVAERAEIEKHLIIECGADEHRVGDVALRCWGAEASFDNVRIVGVPHPDWVAKAAEFYRLLGPPRGDRAVRMPEQPKAAATIKPSVEGNIDPSGGN